MKKLWAFMLTLLICVGMIMVFTPSIVHAAKQEGDIAGGVYDGVDWRITSEGELIIGNGTEQTFTYRANREYNNSYPWYSYRTQIKTGRFDGKVYGNGSMSNMFYYCSSLTSLDLSGFDTSKVTDMGSMFSGCSKLTSLNVSKFDTSKVTSMNNMFYKCSSIASLDLSGFDTSNVTGMSNMFYNCSKLISLDVSKFDTSNVTNMHRMFCDCLGLTSLDVSKFDTSNVTDMNYMFYNCSKLTSLDVSKFDTSKVTNMSSMFSYCSKLTSLDVSKFDTSKVTNMSSMFSYCSKLTSLDVSNFDTSDVTNMSTMFWGCSSLASLDVSKFDTSNVTDMNYMFSGCSKLTSLNVSKFDTSKVTDMGSMFSGCSKLTSLNVSKFDTSKVTDMFRMFYNCSKLISLDLSKFDTSNVTNMGSMFVSCTSLTEVKFGSGFSFSGNGITNDNYKALLPTPSNNRQWIRDDGVYGPYTAAQLRDNYTSEMAGTWKWTPSAYAVFNESDGTLYFVKSDDSFTNGSTGAVTSISGRKYAGRIFVVNETTGSRNWGSIASKVKKVQFVDKIKPKNINSWFASFSNCVDFDLKELNTSDVVNMGQVFMNCKAIVNLDLSSFDTSNVTNATQMFSGCTSLKSLDISGFNTANISSWSNFFASCNSLRRINLGEDFVFTTQYGLLPNYTAGGYTGKWIREDKAFGPYSSQELTNNYTSVMAGWWIWEEKPYSTIIFTGPSQATGSMSNDTLFVNEDFKIPVCQYAIFDHTFLYWDDGQGNHYENKATIPAGTYEAGATITLTAVFEKNSHNVNMEDGSFTFDIKAGEKATFDNIPAGTTYQIYEKTEDGWVLVQQENASGVIEALEESAAVFWNKYQPGVVTVQFTGTKKLDGHPAKEGTYSFELLDSDRNVIQTKTLLDGGFIQFDPIEYTKDDLGEHTYIIREIDPHDEGIDYDVHEETVTVLVKEEGSTKYSHTDNVNDAGEKQGDYTSNQYYTDIITIPGAEKLHVTVKYTNPRGQFYIWKGAHDEVHTQTYGSDFNPNTALKPYYYQSGKDQEYLTDEFDVDGDSISVLYSSYAYPQDASNYSDMVNYGYYITVSNEKLVADVTYDEDGVAFNNTTRPGILKITKDGSELTEANKDDKFTFEITFSNENGMPISDNIYWYVEDQN